MKYLVLFFSSQQMIYNPYFYSSWYFVEKKKKNPHTQTPQLNKLEQHLLRDFSETFDSIHKGKMEQIFPAYGLPKETVTAIMMLYEKIQK